MTSPSIPGSQPQDSAPAGQPNAQAAESRAEPVGESDAQRVAEREAQQVADLDGAAAVPERAQTRQFAFDGGAGTYLGTAMLALLVTVFTLGICYPFGLVLRERWRAKHSYIEGRQLVFNGSAWGLFGLWWKWLILSIITIGIYLFWVGPRVYRWKWEHTSWARQTWSAPRPRAYG